MTLLALLFVKHFICDFAYQPPYQWMNKGTWGHPGGLLHAGQHALATAFILCFYGSLGLAVSLALAEFYVHYVTDWAKMNVNARYGWRCSTSNEFWISLGVDQLIHALTYVAAASVIL